MNEPTPQQLQRRLAAAADETAVYDTVELLIERHGVAWALAVMRYLYVVSTFNDGQKGAR